MKFYLNTHDIQVLMIALITHRTDEIVTDDGKKYLTELLARLNNLCREENNFAITLTATSTPN